MSTRTRLARLRPEPIELASMAAVLNAELLTLLLYVHASNYRGGAIRYLLYPFVWINVAGLAVLYTTPTAERRRRRYGAAAVAVGYFLVLGYVGGLFGPAHGTSGMEPTGLNVSWLPPGWGPALLYGGEWVRVSLVPFKLVGYGALAYLVYATVLDASKTAVSGALGLLSCVSCTWPIVASLIAGVAGTGSTLAVAAAAQSYDVSTAVFVVTVALLYWRPFGE